MYILLFCWCVFFLLGFGFNCFGLALLFGGLVCILLVVYCFAVCWVCVGVIWWFGLSYWFEDLLVGFGDFDLSCLWWFVCCWLVFASWLCYY